MMDKEKPIHSIVLDAGPLLLNQPSISTLLAKSEQIFTTPSVLSEIKDENARQRLETTVRPFLIVRNPSPTSIRVVSDFAKKTGDAAVLSGTDLHVFALAYELECERNHGDWRLRSTPGQKRLNGSPPKLDDTKDESADAPETVTGEANSFSQSEDQSATTAQVTETPVADDDSTESHAGIQGQASASDPDHVPEISDDPSKLDLEGETAAPHEAEPVDEEDPVMGEALDPNDDQDSDDSEGWITPSNLRKHQAKDDRSAMTDEAPQATLQVATLTTDFALQNSLLLMNLNLLSTSLSRIAHLKSHILRCHACFATTKDMTKQFCHRCGGPTLTRVSCSTTSKGGFKLHLKKNMQWNTRGDRYSIPKPAAGTSNGKLGKGGRGQGGKGGWGKELMLAEDQKEYVRAMTSQQKHKQRDLMDGDYLPSILTGERAGGGRVRVGAGRNVNSKKRQ